MKKFTILLFTAICLVIGASDAKIADIATNKDSECEEDGQLLPHESDCTKFYQCLAGEKYELDCPEGLEFNPVVLACDWPEHAGCQTTTTKNIYNTVKIL